MEITKRCTCCNMLKLVVSFHKDSTHADGYRTVCKVCRKKPLEAFGSQSHKLCSACLISKPNTTEYFCEYEHSTKRRRHKTLCLECYNVSRRGAHIKKRYGITKEDYQRMAQAQDFKCLLCGQKKKLHIDHNHSTKRVRGLLCSECNRGIGFLKENISTLQNAIKYLQEEV